MEQYPARHMTTFAVNCLTPQGQSRAYPRQMVIFKFRKWRLRRVSATRSDRNCCLEKTFCIRFSRALSTYIWRHICISASNVRVRKVFSIRCSRYVGL